MKARPSAEYVRSILDYDPETGIFRWRFRATHPPKWNGKWAGKIAGTLKIEKSGYKRTRIAIDKAIYSAHILAWVYVTGVWPELEIDHKDGDSLNNKFINLIQATRQQNSCNRGKPANNTSGYKGVSWHSKRRCWQAYIMLNFKHIYIGSFKTKEEAYKAYCERGRLLHGQFFHP